MLPQAESYDELRRAFRWEVPPLYNIGVDVCDKWAEREPDRVAIIEVREDGRDRGSASPACARSPTDSPTCSPRMVSGRATASASCCRRRRETASATSRSTSSARIAVPLFTLFGEEALAFRLGDAGVRAVITDAPRRGQARRDARRPPGAGTASSRSTAGGRRARFRRRRWREQSDELCARADPRRRSGADHLHLGHDRSAEGRASRAPGAARPSARRGDAPRFLSAARRPHLDARRLGLDRRPARRADAGAASWRAGDCAALRQVHRRGGVRADGARMGCATSSCRRPR